MNAYTRPTRAQIAARPGSTTGPHTALHNALKSIAAAETGAALYDALIGLHGPDTAGAIIRAADRALWRDLRP